MDVREKLVELLKANFYDEYEFKEIADILIAHGVTVQDNTEISDELLKRLRNAPLTVLHEEPTIELVQEWISVKDRLPEENEYVMIWCGECQIARIEKGISEEQRNAMKRGELDDPCETGWTLSSGYFTLKRSQAYKACDEQGNNRVPFCWYSNGGPLRWFGQEVTHWAYLPQPPKGE